MTRKLIRSLVPFVLIALMSPAFATTVSSIVYTRGQSVVLMELGKQPRVIATVEGEIVGPVFSPDRTKIALFDRGPISSDKLGVLRIFDAQGKTLGEPIDPDPDQVELFSYVQWMYWAGNKTIVLGNLWNPSATTSLLIDVTRGKKFASMNAYADFYSISPKKNRLAYVFGIPQSGQEENKMMGAVYVDDRKVQSLHNIEFLSAPVWDPDEKHIAIVARPAKTTVPKAYIIEGTSRRVTASYPIKDAGDPSNLRFDKISWKRAGLVVGNQQAEWRIDPQARTPAIRKLGSMSQAEAPEQLEADTIRDKYLKDVDLDSWDYSCTQCTKDQ